MSSIAFMQLRGVRPVFATDLHHRTEGRRTEGGCNANCLVGDKRSCSYYSGSNHQRSLCVDGAVHTLTGQCTPSAGLDKQEVSSH